MCINKKKNFAENVCHITTHQKNMLSELGSECKICFIYRTLTVFHIHSLILNKDGTYCELEPTKKSNFKFEPYHRDTHNADDTKKCTVTIANCITNGNVTYNFCGCIIFCVLFTFLVGE